MIILWAGFTTFAKVEVGTILVHALVTCAQNLTIAICREKCIEVSGQEENDRETIQLTVASHVRMVKFVIRLLHVIFALAKDHERMLGVILIESAGAIRTTIPLL
jgi:hypothetical protein